jgi:hypothetical protein
MQTPGKTSLASLFTADYYWSAGPAKSSTADYVMEMTVVYNERLPLLLRQRINHRMPWISIPAMLP